jgi:hypothetical protein
VLPGSNESGVLLLSKVMVPPLWVDELTTPVMPALNDAAPVVDGGVLPLLLLPPLLQALINSAATAPAAVAAKILRLFMP